jgi:hypothetical protein
MANSIYSAMMRKIMSKAGFKMSGLFNEVAVSNPIIGTNPAENSSGLRFIYSVKLQGFGTVTNVLYDTVDNQNFGDILNSFGQFKNHIWDYLRGEQGGGTREATEPFKLAVYTKDVNAGTDQWRLGAEMYLEDLSIQLDVSSTLTIQNRTKAADATTDLSTDRVDSQPLKGYIYEFKHADPRVRFSGPEIAAGTNSNQMFNRMNTNGLALIRGNQFNPATEPLDPKYFANLSKATKITIQPGEMKKTFFTYRFSGKITNLLKKMQVTRYLSGPNIFTGMIGKCQFIALEELMRTPSTNLIQVAYEREMTMGCTVKYKYHDTPLDDIINGTEINNLL